MDKYISKIIQKYTGHTKHHVKNSAHFVESIKDLKVGDEEILVSYDVTALYPSVPQQEAIQIFHEAMIKDENLQDKTSISAENITTLFKICVETTYFVFNRNLYQQIDGLAIGASSSGPAADLFMERMEQRAITTFVEPPDIWLRYVDDTFSKLKMIHVDTFMEHLNSQHPRINFTTETQQNNKIAFLDTLVNVLPDGSTKTTIYRKSTHTDQYLDFDSHHHMKQKLGIYRTFEHRIEKLVTTEEDKKVEISHTKQALRRCGHPKWSLRKKKKNNQEMEKEEKRGKVVLPYIKGISERMARTYKKYNIETIHKPMSKLKHILCNKMKDKVDVLDKTGGVYLNVCKKHPGATYVGETERVLRERMYEHRMIDHKTAKRSASLSQPEESQEEPERSRRSKRNVKKVNYKTMESGLNQPLTLGNTEFSAHVASDIHEKEDLEYKLLCTDEDWYQRGVKEAIAIRSLKPTLNQDDGRHHLSAMYSKFIRTSHLFNTSRKGADEATVHQN